jgi:hypothetical protein
MRRFARKPEARQIARARAMTGSRAREMWSANSMLHLQRTMGNQAVGRMLSTSGEERSRAFTSHEGARFGGELSALVSRPSHPRSEGDSQFQNSPRLAAKGEIAVDDVRFGPVKGDPTKKEAPTAKNKKDKDDKKDKKNQKVRKTELGAPVTGECGQYSWQVRFSIDNADDTTKGYIVQKIDVKYNRSECDNKVDPVTGVGKFPYWEAWGVREGKVYVGDTDQAHNADTYSDRSMGDGTKGSIVVKGIPQFFPDVTLPADMKANNPDTQAGDLRSSLTDPKLKDGTGALAHNLTASWKCCPPDEKKATTVEKS